MSEDNKNDSGKEEETVKTITAQNNAASSTSPTDTTTAQESTAHPSSSHTEPATVQDIMNIHCRLDHLSNNIAVFSKFLMQFAARNNMNIPDGLSFQASEFVEKNGVYKVSLCHRDLVLPGTIDVVSYQYSEAWKDENLPLEVAELSVVELMLWYCNGSTSGQTLCFPRIGDNLGPELNAHVDRQMKADIRNVISVVSVGGKMVATFSELEEANGGARSVNTLCIGNYEPEVEDQYRELVLDAVSPISERVFGIKPSRNTLHVHPPGEKVKFFSRHGNLQTLVIDEMPLKGEGDIVYCNPMLVLTHLWKYIGLNNPAPFEDVGPLLSELCAPYEEAIRTIRKEYDFDLYKKLMYMEVSCAVLIAGLSSGVMLCNQESMNEVSTTEQFNSDLKVLLSQELEHLKKHRKSILSFWKNHAEIDEENYLDNQSVSNSSSQKKRKTRGEGINLFLLFNFTHAIWL